MQQFHNFYIHTPEFDEQNRKVVFHYSFDESEYFQETLSLSDTFSFREEKDALTIENILFHVSIAFGISYYKLFPTKNIIVDSGTLSQEQKDYWRDFYVQGLWEFFYTNNIDFTKLCYFTSTSTQERKKREFTLSKKTLLPIGWGKDSIVSSLLLEWKEVTPFIFGKIDAIKQGFLDIYWNPELLIERQLDPKLFEMNAQGYYNGHVPITGLISFFLTFVCYIYDYKFIVFSNEKSADSWNTDFHGESINHQYSKSSNFREGFSDYIREYISWEISYNSLLWEYYEIEIAKIFAEKGKKYFDVFSSCNKNFSIQKQTSQRWCNNCPKCLFVYMILRPFLSKTETLQIFWEELYERKDLENLFLETIWVSGIKPFECVGEVDEAKLAAYMSIEKFEKLPYLLEVFQNTIPDFSATSFRKKYNV